MCRQLVVPIIIHTCETEYSAQNVVVAATTYGMQRHAILLCIRAISMKLIPYNVEWTPSNPTALGTWQSVLIRRVGVNLNYEA